jgi:hypothetical protein
VTENEADRRQAATEIFNSYLDKDIGGWLEVDKKKEFGE